MLKCKSRINKSSGNTQYLTIPAPIVRDSQYPFKEGEQVIINIDVERGSLTVKKEEKNG